MDDAIHQLIYCSRNVIADCHTDVDAEIMRILDVSRCNNLFGQVTGALLFSMDSFAQVLEGPRTGVIRTFERIQRDPRHADIVVLRMHCSGRRDFAGWSMAYASKLSAANKAACALLRAGEQQGAAAADAVLAILRAVVNSEEEEQVLADLRAAPTSSDAAPTQR